MEYKENDIRHKWRQKLVNMPSSDREKFLLEKGKDGRPNAQIIYSDFKNAGAYALGKEGALGRLHDEIKEAFGEETHDEIMSVLKELQAQKIERLKKEAPEDLMHASHVPPDKMGDSLQARENRSQFGEHEQKLVFATDDMTQRYFYSLRDTSAPKDDSANYGLGTAETPEGKKFVFLLRHILPQSHTYFMPSENFTPTVGLDGAYGNEWRADADVTYSFSESNKTDETLKKADTALFYHIPTPEALKELGDLTRDINFTKYLRNPKTMLKMLDRCVEAGLLKQLSPDTSKVDQLKGIIRGKNHGETSEGITLNSQLHSKKNRSR